MFQSFFPLSAGEEEERAAPCFQTPSAPGNGGQSFDDVLETNMGKSVLRVSSSDSSEKLLVSLFQG